MRKASSVTTGRSKLLRFPAGFLWGAAASSHQVEGGNYNNWTEWESVPGHIADGSKSGKACDHYRRFEKDFDDLKRLGYNTHRLSIEWSRLEPRPGEWNEKEFGHYRRVLGALKKRGLKPMVTLHHFTNPIWFERMGAFAHPEAPAIFERFAVRAAEELGNGIKLWCTINEPVIYSHFGYLDGIWPPGKNDFGLASRVLRGMIEAHLLAYRALHRLLGPDIMAGVAMHFRLFDPLRPGNAADRFSAGVLDFFLNRSFLIALVKGVLYPPLGVRKRLRRGAGAVDFIGVNYYTREMVRFNPRRGDALFAEMSTRPGAKSNSLGWEIYPQGLYRVLAYCSRFGLPLYVTENGTTEIDDADRTAFIASHLEAAHRAVRAGADVRGYYYWSALDNFEWAEGYTARFGLIGVDFKTQKRTIRGSARFLAKVARQNALPWPQPSRGTTKNTKGEKRTRSTQGGYGEHGGGKGKAKEARKPGKRK
ncbi:MAG: glycoside hydrolase family 1 protein [Spirochaetales bacterium]|nr:glycoside hydrolase family 1 protein [Spirochaetales bacterium]